MNDRVYVMRQSIVKLTQMLAGRGIEVTQQGITAYVRADRDGRPVLVNLPYMPDNATEELIDAIQGFLDHEVAHILFTEFPVMGEAHAAGCDSLYNILEDSRIEKLMGKRFQGSTSNLANTARFFLDKYTTPKMTEAIAGGDQNMLVGVLMVPLMRGMSGQDIYSEYMKDKMPMMDEVYGKIKDLAPKIEGIVTSRDAFEMAKEITKRLRDGDPEAGKGKGKGGKPKTGDKVKVASAKPGSEEDEGEEEKVETKVKVKGAKKPPAKPPAPTPKEEESAPAPGDEEEDEETTPAAGEEEPAPTPTPEEEETTPAAGAEPDEEEKSPEPDEEGGEDIPELELVDEDGEPVEPEEELVPPEASDSAVTKEGETIDTTPMSAASWKAIDKESKNDFDATLSNLISNSAVDVSKHADYLIFSTDGDVVEPLHVGSGYNAAMLVDLGNKVDHMVAPMQKDLERAISARSMAVFSSGHRSGRIHAANLTRLNFNDDRIFRRKHESTSKDVAVELVVDMSGSMNGSRIHTAAAAAYALATVLDRIGIKNEVICFTTGAVKADRSLLQAETAKLGRSYSRIETLYMPVLKSFTERMTTDVKARFAWLPNCSSMASNVDGESVEIAARRLLARRETGKVMLVMSDGNPACSGSSGPLMAHLKKVVKDISKAGVNVIGIGIQSDAVRQYYPKCMVIQDVAELPGAVMKELRALIIK